MFIYLEHGVEVDAEDVGASLAFSRFVDHLQKFSKNFEQIIFKFGKNLGRFSIEKISQHFSKRSIFMLQ